MNIYIYYFLWIFDHSLHTCFGFCQEPRNLVLPKLLGRGRYTWFKYYKSKECHWGLFPPTCGQNHQIKKSSKVLLYKLVNLLDLRSNSATNCSSCLARRKKRSKILKVHLSQKGYKLWWHTYMILTLYDIHTLSIISLK